MKKLVSLAGFSAEAPRSHRLMLLAGGSSEPRARRNSISASAERSTGFGRCAWYPASSAAARSFCDVYAVTATAGMRDSAPFLAASQLPDQGVAVFARHADVGDDDIEPRLTQYRERLVSTLDRRHVGARADQSCGGHLTGTGVVVHHEDADAVEGRKGPAVEGWRRDPRAIGCWLAVPGGPGSSRMNRAP